MSAPRGVTPLVVFLFLGGAVFTLDRWRGGDDRATRTIEIGELQLAGIRERWTVQWDRPPTEAELRGLVNDAIREEILYREALRLGLDRDDTIVRRRLAQKMTFMLEDGVGVDPPDEATVSAYHAAHGNRYREPRRTTFVHVYLSRDRREDPEADAATLLDQLTTGPPNAWRQLGDPFMLLREYADRSDQEIAELFGSDFAGVLGDLPPNGWRGPVRSAYGVHLVRVVARADAQQLPLDEIRERVIQDLLADRRRELKQTAFDELRERYDVQVGDLGASQSDTS